MDTSRLQLPEALPAEGAEPVAVGSADSLCFQMKVKTCLHLQRLCSLMLAKLTLTVLRLAKLTLSWNSEPLALP